MTDSGTAVGRFARRGGTGAEGAFDPGASDGQQGGRRDIGLFFFGYVGGGKTVSGGTARHAAQFRADAGQTHHPFAAAGAGSSERPAAIRAAPPPFPAHLFRTFKTR